MVVFLDLTGGSQPRDDGHAVDFHNAMVGKPLLSIRLRSERLPFSGMDRSSGDLPRFCGMCRSMIDHGSAAALIGLSGVLLGGGLNALQAELNRWRDRRALTAVLRADVASLLSLLSTRRIVEGLEEYLCWLDAEVTAGRGSAVRRQWRIPMSSNYFTCHEAMMPRFPLLTPADATRFSRFYAYAKAATEVVMLQQPGTAPEWPVVHLAAITRTELTMIKQVRAMGEEIIAAPRSSAPAPDAEEVPLAAMPTDGHPGKRAHECPPEKATAAPPYNDLGGWNESRTGAGTCM